MSDENPFALLAGPDPALLRRIFAREPKLPVKDGRRANPPTPPDNPWGLTVEDERTLTALNEKGTNAAAARSLRIGVRKLETQIDRITRKMGLECRLHTLLWWDRWQREGKA